MARSRALILVVLVMLSGTASGLVRALHDINADRTRPAAVAAKAGESGGVRTESSASGHDHRRCGICDILAKGLSVSAAPDSAVDRNLIDAGRRGQSRIDCPISLHIIAARARAPPTATPAQL